MKGHADNMDDPDKPRSSSHLKKDVRKERDVYHIPITSGSGPGKKDEKPPEEVPVKEEAGKSVTRIDEDPSPEKENEKAVESAIKIVEEAKKEAGLERDEEIEELNERIKRISAEFENFRRRKEAEASETRKYASERIILELLPIMDNFERALSTSKTSRNFDSLLEGIQMIYRQMRDILEKEGLQAIDCEGQLFDPALHQAVMMVESDEHPDESIVEELIKGYRLKDKVIRPCMVKVSRKKT